MEGARIILSNGDKELALPLLKKAADKVYEVRGCSVSRTFLVKDDARERAPRYRDHHPPEHVLGSLRVKRLTFVGSCFCLLTCQL